MATHTAIVTVKKRAPLEAHQVPTVAPGQGEVRILNQWTASTPVDLHQNDGGLLVTHPQILGDAVGGPVVEVGPGVTSLKKGDLVFGFTYREAKEKAYQDYVVADARLLGKAPDGFTLAELVTVPNNFVTAVNVMITDLELPLPWPRPDNYVPEKADVPVLIWGGGTSVGQFMLELMHYYGYRNLMVTASPKHHDMLRAKGATKIFNYRHADVVDEIKTVLGQTPILAVDGLGSKNGSIAPLAKIAPPGSRVAIMLPVIVRDATEEEEPIMTMDVREGLDWAKDVDARGVRTHFYWKNNFMFEKAQPEMMPALIKQGVIRPQKQKIIEGKTLLQRAQNALDSLRRREPSGERLVWRVTDLENGHC